jgi:hypothetical protein
MSIYIAHISKENLPMALYKDQTKIDLYIDFRLK